ncbi:MAG: hypothetical protein HFF37_03080 [Coprobacillus sp.]|nr:hypothetical protein [Coprobacillus sp.]
MKSKLSLISSIVQLVFGTLAIVAFIMLLIIGEDISKWLITLLLAIAFVIIGIIGIIEYISNC